MNERVKILYIEDDPLNQALVRKLLSHSNFDIIEAGDGIHGVERARNESPDLILMDMSMPGLDGYETTTRMKSMDELREIPIIALTAHAMKGDRERCLTAGCDGYIPKPIDPDTFISKLGSYLNGEKEQVHEHERTGYLEKYNQKLVMRLEDQVKELQMAYLELERINQELELRVEKKAREVVYQAHHDSLTGLANRRLFMERLERSIEQTYHTKQQLVVMFLDLDRFKVINDTLGHGAGDKLLQVIAQRIQACLHTNDTVARLGGDEFIFILTNLATTSDAAPIAQRIIDTISLPISLCHQEVFVTGSIGIARSLHKDEDMESLIKHADIAMYRAKERGRNNFQFYSREMNARAGERLSMETSLRRALDRQEFILHYQPQIDLTSGRIIGAEALIRWQHPERGLIAPCEFIPLLEDTGLVVPVGEWVLLTACEQNKQWQLQGLPEIRIAVNISAHQFNEFQLSKSVSKVLDQTRLNPKCLELEITESVIMQNAKATITALHKLADMGINISMDDFGTGYSSLAYLKQFSLDTLKIDRSFIKDANVESDMSSIVTAVIWMAHSLRMGVIAEGVESEAQVQFLHGNDCDAMQGFIYSQPVVGDEFTTILSTARELVSHQ